MIAPTPGSGCFGYLREIGHYSLHADVEAIDGGPRGDVERFQIDAAEGKVGGLLAGVERADEIAFGGIDENVAGGDVEVAGLIYAEACGSAFDFLDYYAVVRGDAVLVEIEGVDGLRVGIGDIKEIDRLARARCRWAGFSSGRRRRVSPFGFTRNTP